MLSCVIQAEDASDVQDAVDLLEIVSRDDQTFPGFVDKLTCLQRVVERVSKVAGKGEGQGVLNVAV